MMKFKMTPKQIVFAVMCVLLALVMILSGIVISKFSRMFQTSGGNTTSTAPSETTEAPSPSTQPTETEQTEPATTQPTEPEDPSHVHEFVLTETVAATCENYGYNIYACACGKQDIPLDEQVEPYGHSYSAGSVISATCTEDGCTKYVCSRCGDVDLRNVTPATGHNYQLAESVTSTCGMDGYSLYRCVNCGAEEMRDIVPALQHQYDIVEEQAGSCEQDGYTLYRCANCGSEFKDNVIPAAGHQFCDWYQLADGTWKRDCANCAVKETSADLQITKSQVSGDYVHDENGNPYKMYMIYVGTASNSDMFHYTINDYLDNGSLTYGYDPTKGLVVTYTTGAGETITTTLPIFQSSSFTIPADDAVG